MKTRLAVLLAAALCVLAGGVTAQSVPDDQGVEMLGGIVLSSSASSLVVRTDSGIQRTFAITQKTLLPLTALATGDRVSVKFRVLDASHAEAVDVTVVDAEPVASVPLPIPRSVEV